jgi:hypothetical protein
LRVSFGSLLPRVSASALRLRVSQHDPLLLFGGALGDLGDEIVAILVHPGRVLDLEVPDAEGLDDHGPEEAVRQHETTGVLRGPRPLAGRVAGMRLDGSDFEGERVV